MLDGFLVLGTEAGRQGRHRHEQGRHDALRRRELQEGARGRVRATGSGLFYVNSPQFLKSRARAAHGAAAVLREVLQGAVRRDRRRRQRRRGVRGQRPGGDSRSRSRSSARAATCSSELPADSWLALAQTDFGKLIDFYVDAFARRRRRARRDRAAVQAPPPGSTSRQDVIDWMGDFGVFVRGTSVAEPGRGARHRDQATRRRPAASSTRLARLARTQGAESGRRVGPLSRRAAARASRSASHDIPKPIHVFQRDGRVVVAYGDAAAEDAVDPSEKLGDSPDFSRRARLARRLRRLVLLCHAADPRPGRVDRRGERRRLAGARSPTSSR